MACALAAAAALALLTVLLITTRSGTLEISVDPPGAQVTIDGAKITLAVPNVKDKIEVQLRPGEHTFEVYYSGFSTQTGSFKLDAGGRHVLAVKLLEPLPPPPSVPPTAIAPFDAANAQQHQKAWAKYLGVPTVQTNSIGMRLTLIPPGEFMMGSPQEVIDEEMKRPKTNAQDWYLNNVPLEGPQHRVRITRPYWLGTTVVTQEEYQRVIGSNPSLYKGPKRPAERVSWDDAVEFCRKLSELPEEKAAHRVVLAADRGPVGTCMPCGNDDPLVFGR